MLSLTTRTDAHGNPVSGTQSAVDRYDAAIDHLLAYREELVDTVTSLVNEDRRLVVRRIGTAPPAFSTIC